MYYLFYNTGNILFKETIMEDKQRVYIKGDRNRGNEIIKLLEDLGGKNTYRYNGEDDNIYYYIAPDGVIKVVAYTYEIFPFIEEFYKEIKLPRWKPKNNEYYYRITWLGEVAEDIWYGSLNDESGYKFGNCFKTIEEAEVARDKIKNVLNK